MSLLVHKYGGTSVGSIERIKAVAERIAADKSAGHEVAVVVSAMSGETNRLTDLAMSISNKPIRREMDVLLASGEQVSVALLAMTLDGMGIHARSYLADQIKVHTDNNHVRARIQHIDNHRLLKVLHEGCVPVIAGFQGVNEDGDITTIGRGGSDTSAVAIAAALNADECLIYTDVDGVYTADPRIVEKAQRLEEVEFEEMLEMASLGAKVLHSRAVEFAHKHDVSIRVLSSFEEGRGTLISSGKDHAEKPVVSGITCEKDTAKLTVAGVDDTPGVAFKILGPVGDADIAVDMIVQNISHEGHTDLSFTVKRGDFDQAREILERLTHHEGFERCSVEATDDIAKVTIVGVGMRSHAGVATRMFETLARENINIMMISTSEIKISIVIAERYVELAMRALHSAFDLDD